MTASNIVGAADTAFPRFDDASIPSAETAAALATPVELLQLMDGWLANTGHAGDHPWRISITETLGAHAADQSGRATTRDHLVVGLESGCYTHTVHAGTPLLELVRRAQSRAQGAHAVISADGDQDDFDHVSRDLLEEVVGLLSVLDAEFSCSDQMGAQSPVPAPVLGTRQDGVNVVVGMLNDLERGIDAQAAGWLEAHPEHEDAPDLRDFGPLRELVALGLQAGLASPSPAVREGFLTAMVDLLEGPATGSDLCVDFRHADAWRPLERAEVFQALRQRSLQ